jgi:hypothetical protein
MKYSFDIDEVKKHGIECAIVLDVVRHFIYSSHSPNLIFKNNEWWALNNNQQWADLFPYFSYDQVRSHIKTLISNGALKSARMNHNMYDKKTLIAVVKNES